MYYPFQFLHPWFLRSSQFLHPWLRARNSPPPPAFELIYEGAIGQPKQTTSLCNPLLQQLLPLLSIIRLEEGESIVDILDGVCLGRELLDEDPLPPHQLGHAQRAEMDAHF